MKPILTTAATLWLCSAALLFTGCSQPAEKEVQPEVTVQMEKLAPRALEEHVTSDAVLYPRSQAAITPKIVAPVAQFYVQRGAKVHKGQLLARLENRDLAAAAKDAQGGLQQAQAAYITTTKAGIPAELQKAKLDVAQAQQNLDAQTKLLNSRKTLFSEGALPRKDLDAAQVAYVQAKSQTEIAQQSLKSIQSVSGAQSVKSAQAQLTSAEGKYQGTQAQLNYSEIRSPIDGVVTERLPYTGETPAAGTPLLTIMDTDVIIAKAHMPQASAQQLKVGDPATLTVSGIDHPVAGKVTLVSPALDPNSTTVEVWMAVPNKDHQLKPGSATTVDVVAHKVADALAVPKSAIVQSDKGSAVMLVSADQTAHTQPVETGITDSQQELVQITSGVKAGDTVVTTSAYGLPDGAKVKSAEAAPAEAPAAKPSGGKD
ncbi:MAG: efflux RND transporter periplasmic adaptor subunit [Acidobacteriaceae bacterium]